MNHRLLCAFCIVTLLAAAQNATAVEPLSARELAEHCAVYPETPEGVDGQFCVRYIQGFIDGAVATDERVLRNVEAELNRKETYTERAIRIRGPDRLRERAARYAEFCLGEPVALRDVVDKVVADLDERELVEDAVARTVVYASLRKHYPCKPLAESSH